MIVDIELTTQELAALSWLSHEPSWQLDRKVERIEMAVWRKGRRFNTQVASDLPAPVAMARLALQARRLIDHFEGANK